jgi:hypothetical protein
LTPVNMTSETFTDTVSSSGNGTITSSSSTVTYGEKECPVSPSLVSITILRGTITFLVTVPISIRKYRLNSSARDMKSIPRFWAFERKKTPVRTHAFRNSRRKQRLARMPYNGRSPLNP